MMELSLLIAVFVLLCIEGFYSGSEIALLSCDRLDLKKKARKGNHGARLALALLEQPDRILSTTLLMTNLCAICIAEIITISLDGHGAGEGWLPIAVASGLIIILGEILPKTLFQRFSSKITPVIVYPVFWAFFIFYPVTRLLSLYTSKLSKLVGPIFEMIGGKKKTSRDEIESILSYGRRETGMAQDEKRMIKRIFDFKDTEAKHALIPLFKVDAVAETISMREALEKFQQHRHSRMPVYSVRIDNIVGTIGFADLINEKDLSQPIHAKVRPAKYASETQILEDLLGEMHRERYELATVVDEYGGAVGILTMEDIVEEVVGEIHDEYDSNRNSFRQVSENSWWVQGKAAIEHLNESLKLEIPEGDYETLAGFLLQQFGRIPDPSDELYFDTPAGTLRLTVKQATERAIESVLVEKIVADNAP